MMSGADLVWHAAQLTVAGSCFLFAWQLGTWAVLARGISPALVRLAVYWMVVFLVSGVVRFCTAIFEVGHDRPWPEVLALHVPLALVVLGAVVGSLVLHSGLVKLAQEIRCFLADIRATNSQEHRRAERHR